MGENVTAEPIIRGRFAVYRTADGLHVSVRLDGEDDDRHLPVPPMLIRLMPGGKKALDKLLTNLGGNDGVE